MNSSNIAAHRTISPTPTGPKPATRHLSARALTALVSQLTTGYTQSEAPDEALGPMDPYMRRALERSVVGGGMGTELWRVIAKKHPEIWDVIGGDPTAPVTLNPQLTTWPSLACAVPCTSVVPTGKLLPDAGSAITATGATPPDVVSA